MMGKMYHKGSALPLITMRKKCSGFYSRRKRVQLLGQHCSVGILTVDGTSQSAFPVVYTFLFMAVSLYGT
jgi:hypothetical protein